MGEGGSSLEGDFVAKINTHLLVRATWLLTSILPCLATQAVASERVERPVSIKGLDQNEERFYLEGVTDGFQVLNAALMQKGRQPLYCIPRKVVLYGRDVYELASKDLVGPQENIDLLVSALYGLMKKYPCKE